MKINIASRERIEHLPGAAKFRVGAKAVLTQDVQRDGLQAASFDVGMAVRRPRNRPNVLDAHFYAEGRDASSGGSLRKGW